ncbi:hypothetical protein [Lacticaseibacillus zhaodongensis]|uniref:hypothetical protein n=1 Tax=Lacticaseibacillus zhaodongensis TaxID=2668065 RepID=UPI0012D36021|nr:hypothetical protein [Lacticaseibacillus zhaodongensis]
MALTLQSIFTAAGMSLAQDALAGNSKIVFTRGVASIADWSKKSADDIRAATKLDDETQTTGIGGIATRKDSGGKTEQNAVDVLITFNQKDVKADYQLMTVGLFAAPVVDGKQGAEVLYNVTCYSEPQWMLQDSNGSTFTLSIATIVGDLGNVTVVLPSNSDGGLTQDALDLFHAQLTKEYDAKYQKAGSYATSDDIKDMATNEGVDGKLKNYAQNGALADMETKTDAKATYQQKGDWQPAPEDMQSQIDTLNNKISALQAEISGGGRNLLKDTTFIKKQWAADYGRPQIEFTDDGLKLTSTMSGQFGALNTAGIPALVEGHTYTVSVEARGTTKAQFYMMGTPNNSQLFDSDGKSGEEVDSADWTPISVSFVYHAPTTSISGFEIFGAEGGWIEFRKNTLMLTEGSEVVPWEPAAGDPALTPDLAALTARVAALEAK